MNVNLSVPVDLSSSETHNKNVADNQFSHLHTAAKKNFVSCALHPGYWIMKPGIIRNTTRDCPACDKNIASFGACVSPNSPVPTSPQTPPPTTVFAAMNISNAAVATPDNSEKLKSSQKSGAEPVARAAKKVSEIVIRSISYSNGDKYKGEMNANDKEHGSGVYTYENGDVYEGQFVNGKRHGERTDSLRTIIS